MNRRVATSSKKSITLVLKIAAAMHTGPELKTQRAELSDCTEVLADSAVHRGAFCQFSFQWVYNCHISKKKLARLTSMQWVEVRG